MKRILFLTNYPSPYRVRFFDCLGKDAQVTVLFSERREEKSHRNANWFVSGEGGFQPVQLEKKVLSFRGKALCWDVLPWLKKPWDAIVICGYSSPTAMLAMAWLRLRRIPFYLEVDGGLIRQENPLKYRYKRLLVGGATYWLSTGYGTTEYLTHYGAKLERVYHYPFSSLMAREVDEAPASPEEKAALRQELGMGEGKIVLSIGQFIPRKGFDLLLKAAAELPRDVGIYIVGGEATGEYRNLREALDLPNVHFWGFQKKEVLKKIYRAADFFVLPTREDIWGLVVHEAMACGLPVITTDTCVAGVELVTEGHSGRIVPAENVPALRSAMAELLERDLAPMAQAALDTAREYTIENMAAAHLEIFEKED